MKTPPQITIGTTGNAYALAGFDDFDRWMRRNDALYCAAAKNAEAHGMTETDRLRYLLAAMAGKATRAESLLVEHIQRAGLPFNVDQLNTAVSNPATAANESKP